MDRRGTVTMMHHEFMHTYVNGHAPIIITC